jgi:hypothetical protein
MNFVSEYIADTCNLKVLQFDVSLVINGFNSEKNYVTKIVEIPIKFVTGGKVVLYNIKAVVVPNISICLNLPNLGKAVSELRRRGFGLADSELCEDSDELSNINRILGTEAAYCLPVQTMVLGENESSSTMLMTPYGVMIEGSLNKLLSNISALSDDDSSNLSPCSETKNCVVNDANNECSKI